MYRMMDRGIVIVARKAGERNSIYGAVIRRVEVVLEKGECLKSIDGCRLLKQAEE